MQSGCSFFTSVDTLHAHCNQQTAELGGQEGIKTQPSQTCNAAVAKSDPGLF